MSATDHLDDERLTALQDGDGSADDRAHVESLMVGVTEPGKVAGWVAAPATGVHAKPVDYDYVRT